MVERARNHIELAGALSSLTGLEKLAAAKNVAATMATPGWVLIAQLLEDRKAKILDGLVHGSPNRSAAEFAAELAEARGIEIALDAGPTVLFLAERAEERLSESERASG